MHSNPDSRSAAIQFIVMPDGDDNIEPSWFKALPLMDGDPPPVEFRTLNPSRSEFTNLLQFAKFLNSSVGLLFLRCGLELPPHWRQRLSTSIGESALLPRLPAGNYADTVNPLAGLEEFVSTKTIDGWTWLCAENSATPVDEFPLDCLYLPPEAVGNLKHQTSALLLDSLFVRDPNRSLTAGQPNNQACASALGLARNRLQALSEEPPLPEPKAIGLDGRPVTLHISHYWGGGVARWIADIACHDREGHHLVLSACGEPRGRTHGQSLRLYAAGPGRACIREVPLAPAIADTVCADSRYGSMLQEILARFSVGRIMVSSLIGHSLDALRTGLPTAQVLHDFYPAWPLLDQDPLAWQAADGSVDIERALEQKANGLLFSHQKPDHWRALKTSWLETVSKQQVSLIAPTNEVVTRWQALCGKSLPAIEVIGHGFSGWPPDTQPIASKQRNDARLNLVVVGRLSPGKGLRLLEQSLDQLGRFAHLTLVGCGRHGMKMFGRSGVDIILDYQRADLPAILGQIAPQAGLFLSTVPETWNYTLSESRALGLPALATRLGSFIERIDHGLNGWLFDPEPKALIELIEKLFNDPTLLDAAAQRQPANENMDTALAAYWHLKPPGKVDGPVVHVASPKAAASGYLGHQIASARAEIAALEAQHDRLVHSLEERTAWAQRYERLSDDRTRWAKSLESEIQAERVQVKERLDSLESERKQLETSQIELRAELTVSQDHLAQTQDHLARTQEHLDQTREHLTTTEGQLNQTRQDLTTTEGQLNQTRQDLTTTESQLNQTRQDLTTTEGQLNQTRQDFKQTRHALQRNDFELERTKEELRLIFASRSWRWTRPLRFSNRVLDHARQRRAFNPLYWPRLARRLIHSLRFHGLRGTLHLAQGSPPPAPEQTMLPVVETPHHDAPVQPVSLLTSSSPQVSIIIPVYNKVAYTAACLESLRDEAGDTPSEVIVVDDCSSDQTADFLARCDGVTVVHNVENSGFIASCNAGAARARGQFLVFLNNDTTVTAGWLDSLLATFEDFPDAGVVGARLAYPDGRLQEAGGIIFSDASGWNYGRNEDPALPQYNFTSEADYVSGACLAIPRELFENLGGFDSHYAPAYYEDTDLCFRVREKGLKVYCQPACTIIHHEGVSSGTDESSGTKRYQVINREKFRHRWANKLVFQPSPEIASDDPDSVRHSRFHRSHGRVLVIDATTPMPDHDSGSVRMTAMLELMVEHHWRVTFCPQNLKWEGRYSKALQQQGIEVLTAPAVSSMEQWLKFYGADLDLVVVSRHYILAPLIKTLRRTCPRAKIVFDTVDLHFLREQRQAELDSNAGMQAAAERTRQTELALMKNSDISLVVSPVEQEMLVELVPEADIRVLSNIHSLHGCQQPWSARRDVMFVGGFQHPPNVDAAEWLINEIFPLVRLKIPDIKLHLIGSRMPDTLRERAGAGIVIHGFVEDLTPYLNGCRLSLAPLRYGAGVKGKVNQAMAWGMPVVATTCAAEGMFLKDGEDVLLADNATSFAGQVARAYSDEALWQKLSKGGLANVEQYFSRRAAGDVVQGLLSESSPGTIN